MKLPALNTVMDKRRMALTRARFKAWWEGEEFDPTAAEAALATERPDGADDALFEAPEQRLPPRFAALARFWGEHRILPGDETAEALQPARLGAAAEGVVAVFGPGLAAPVLSLAKAHAGKVVVFEWREETRALCQAALQAANLGERVSFSPIDLDAMHLVADVYDGIWSVDDFTYADHAAGLAHNFTKALKPGAAAVIETYVMEPDTPLAPAFATAFAEPHLRPHALLCDLFHDCGLRIEADDDLTAEHAELARAGFKRLETALAAAVEEGLDVFALREIAWEAEAWRARLRLLNQRRLRRVQFVVRKPGPEGAGAMMTDALERAIKDNA